MTDLLSDPSETNEMLDDEYKDLDPLIAKRFRDKDAHIKTLEAEGAEYRNELRARASLEEITERIARQQQAPTPVTSDGNAAPPASNDEPIDISEQVLKILESEKAKANREQNTERVRSGLKERFGADYNQYLLKASKALGVSEKFLADLAATSPDGLLRLVDSLPLKEGDLGTPPPSTVDTSKSFGQTVRKNDAYYKKILKEDRKLYFSPAIQKEMHQESIKQGPKFYE